MRISCTSTLLLCLFLIVFRQTAAAQGKTHKIKSGETLSLLAKKYKTSVGELIRLNPWSEKGLQIGQELKVPGEAPVKEVETSGSNEGKHRVVSGESLSVIARKYGVTVSELEAWNGVKPEKLRIGQELVIKKQGALKEIENNQAETKPKQQVAETKPAPASGEGGRHTVASGESLSSIARKNGTTVAEIKKLNQLKSDQLKAGQQLLLQATGKPAAEIKTAQPASEGLKKTNEAAKSEPAEKKDAAVPAKSLPDAVEVKTEVPAARADNLQGGIREINNTLGYTRIVETGFAETIEGEAESKKHLCLHKSAPVGSILQVKNEVNGQSVFVKVIGKLPDTGSNERIIIRISRQAYDRIMASGKRFPVEVSYPESQP